MRVADLFENGYVVAFDLETTGRSAVEDRPVSAAYVGCRYSEGAKSSEVNEFLINPGFPIDPGASAVHGISDADVADAISLREGCERIIGELRNTWDQKGVLVGMNLGYDLTMVAATARELGLPAPGSDFPVGPIFDVYLVDRQFDRYRKGSRKLTDLASAYGITLQNAHSATADAAVTIELLEAQARKFPEIAALDIENLNSTMAQSNVEWLTSLKAFFERSGKGTVAEGEFSWPIHDF